MIKKQNNTLVVVAGSRDQFKHFLAVNQLSTVGVWHVMCLNDIRGFHGFNYVKTGTWWMLKEIDQIDQYARTHGAQLWTPGKKAG
jgi:hypothetical protein